MAAPLRVLEWPGGDSGWLTDTHNAPPNIQEWLRDHTPLLAAVKINPSAPLRAMAGAWGDGPGADYTLGRWAHRCAANYSVSPEPWLLRLQIEQDLLAPDEPLQGYTLTRVVGQSEYPEKWKPAPWNQPVGEHYFLDTHEGKPGLVLIRGDRRIACACGFGIPDHGRRAPWSLTAYGEGLHPALRTGVPVFGLEAQTLFFHWYLRRQIDKFEVGIVTQEEIVRAMREKREPRPVRQTTRELYPTDEERAAAKAEGRRPRGEVVECGSAAVYWGTGYTPYEPGLATIQKMAEKRGFA